MGDKTLLNSIKSIVEKKEQRNGNGSRRDRKFQIDTKVSIVVLVAALLSIGKLYGDVDTLKEQSAKKETVTVQYEAVQRQINNIREDTKDTRANVQSIYNILYSKFGPPTVRNE